MTGILLAVAIVILLGLSAFLRAGGTAVAAASRARLLQLGKEDARAALAAALMRMEGRLAGALLVGNTLANVLATALATAASVGAFGEPGVLVAALAMTALVLVLAEALPRTLALSRPEPVALAAAPWLRLALRLFGPADRAVRLAARRLLAAGVEARPDPSRGPRPAAPGEAGEPLAPVVEGGSGGDRLDAILDLAGVAGLSVSDVMVHRTRMRELDADEPPARLVAEALASPYTRLPLYRGEADNIIGVLHTKDLLHALHAVAGDAARLDIVSLAKPPWFVPDTTALKDQLAAFLKAKRHFAIVVDEYGEVMGILTLEDIIEEIVGEIEDEHDVPVAGVSVQPGGAVLVAGAVSIRDVNRALGWSLPDEEATTAAGLLIHEAKLIPEVGQAFTFHGVRFVVVSRERNRITLLELSRCD